MLSALAQREVDTGPSALASAYNAKEIPGLNAMRAAAILLVVFSHQGLPVSGSLGVTMFFVLSGFLITRILLKELNRTGTIGLRNFYKRRAMRIFPAFYLCWVVTTLLLLIQRRPIIWTQAAESFLYLANYGRAFLPFHQQESFHMGISWSLAVEEQFYLLWPLALLWIFRKGRSVCGLLTAAIVTIVLWRAALMLIFHVGWEYVYNAFDTRADALLIGCWLATYLGQRGEVSFEWVLRWRWLVLLPVAALAACTLASTSEHSLLAQLTAATIEPLLSGVLLLQLMRWGTVGWAWLEHWIVKLIARLSYSIYLFHPMVLQLQHLIPIRHAQRIAMWPLIPVAAGISYYLVERPIMRLRDRGKEESVLMDDGLHPLGS